MGVFDETRKATGRARYAIRQGIRSAWYAGHMYRARQKSGGFQRPDEPRFEPTRLDAQNSKRLRSAYFNLFLQDRNNVEAGLYPPPDNLKLRDFPDTMRRARAFHQDASAVDERRKNRVSDDLKDIIRKGDNRYPDYYLQNFHYQSDGWFSDESADLYDTQVEALFSGTADAMRRAALAEISRELKGRDQREVTYLDMACGNGRFLRQTMEVFPRLKATGLDLSPNYTEAAQLELNDWPHVEIVQEAAEAMSFDAAKFDIIVSVFLFHELPEDVRARVLAQVQRVLKPGGVFILADSVQFGDYPDMDGILEYFPHGFHEPYYMNYLEWDRDRACADVGLIKEKDTLAFLTKVSTYRNA